MCHIDILILSRSYNIVLLFIISYFYCSKWKNNFCFSLSLVYIPNTESMLAINFNRILNGLRAWNFTILSISIKRETMPLVQAFCLLFFSKGYSLFIWILHIILNFSYIFKTLLTFVNGVFIPIYFLIILFNISHKMLMGMFVIFHILALVLGNAYFYIVKYHIIYF